MTRSTDRQEAIAKASRPHLTNRPPINLKTIAIAKNKLHNRHLRDCENMVYYVYGKEADGPNGENCSLAELGTAAARAARRAGL